MFTSVQPCFDFFYTLTRCRKRKGHTAVQENTATRPLRRIATRRIILTRLHKKVCTINLKYSCNSVPRRVDNCILFMNSAILSCRQQFGQLVKHGASVCVSVAHALFHAFVGAKTM
jgi:hypothetical protein